MQCTAKRTKITNILLAQILALIDDECIVEKAYIKPATNLYNKTCNNLLEIVVKGNKYIVTQNMPNVAVRNDTFDKVPD